MSDDNEVHSLLERQLRRSGLNEDSDVHEDPAFRELLRRVTSTYNSSDRDRYLLERSLEISSTEMEELHGRLEDERNLLDSVLNSLSDAVILLSPGWTIQFLNRSAEGLLGPDPASDRTIFEWMSFESERLSMLSPDEILNLLRAEDVLFETHVTVRPRFGKEFPASVTFNPVVAHGELTGIVLSIVDITDRLRAEKAVQIARVEVEAAEQARRAQAAFLASMSHELRTPLNAVIGYAELVIEEAGDLGYDEIKPDLDRINRAGRQLLALINDVLDMSKIQSGQLDIATGPCNLDSLVDEVAETLQPMARKLGNKIVVEGSAGVVESDPQKLRQAVLNIASNANKFTSDGTITIRKKRIEDGATIEIEDQGIGMSEEILTKIFEPFMQADLSTTRQYGGTGLGLAITRQICQRLKVEIEVSSEVDVGTTFELTVPTSLDAPIEEPNSQFDDDLMDVDVAGMRLLIIDDDAATHDLVSRYLEPHGVEVISSTDGEAGIRLAHQEQPDVIIVDIIMPLVNGWDVLERLKSDETTWSIPVLVVSIVENSRRAVRYGAAGSMTKPIERRTLINELARCKASATGDDAHEERA